MYLTCNGACGAALVMGILALASLHACVAGEGWG